MKQGNQVYTTVSLASVLVPSMWIWWIQGCILYPCTHIIRWQVYVLSLGGSSKRGKGGVYSIIRSPGKSVPTVRMAGFLSFCGISFSLTNFWFWQWVRFSLPWILIQGILQNRNTDFCNSFPTDLFWQHIFQGQKLFVTLSLDRLTRFVSGLESNFYMWYTTMKKKTYIIKCFLKKPYSIAVFVQTSSILFPYKVSLPN